MEGLLCHDVGFVQQEVVLSVALSVVFVIFINNKSVKVVIHLTTRDRAKVRIRALEPVAP